MWGTQQSASMRCLVHLHLEMPVDVYGTPTFLVVPEVKHRILSCFYMFEKSN